MIEGFKNDKNARPEGQDFLGNPITKGMYIVWTGANDSGRSAFKVGIAYGFTPKGIRFITINERYGNAHIGVVQEREVAILDKDKIPTNILKDYKEYEDYLTLPQKMKII